MLAYAFHILKKQGYEKCSTEDFENTADLLSAILINGITIQLKQGINRNYIEQNEKLSCIRGKINISDSIKQQTFIKQQLVCSFDEFSLNSYMNRIIKTTMKLLLRLDVSKSRKKTLKNLLSYFSEVETTDIHSINWNFRFNRNNQSYQMIMSVCYLIIKGLLQTTSDGSIKLMKFLDEQRMCSLFEKFILEYFKKHYPQIKTSTSQINWALDNDYNAMLPVMQSDIMLTYCNKTLIIDAKYYAHTTQNQYNTATLHSNNLYQIFAYVKNKAATSKETVSGMLLYVLPKEDMHLDNTYMMSGNQISVKTLNLNCDFSVITHQLNTIAETFIDT